MINISFHHIIVLLTSNKNDPTYLYLYLYLSYVCEGLEAVYWPHKNLNLQGKLQYDNFDDNFWLFCWRQKGKAHEISFWDYQL